MKEAAGASFSNHKKSLMRIKNQWSKRSLKGKRTYWIVTTKTITMNRMICGFTLSGKTMINRTKKITLMTF